MFKKPHRVARPGTRQAITPNTPLAVRASFRAGALDLADRIDDAVNRHDQQPLPSLVFDLDLDV